MYATGSTPIMTFDTTTGAFNFIGATPFKQVFFYPSEPVMGLVNWETNILNDRPAIAFDTQFAYQYSGGTWGIIGPTSGSQFNGDDANFFNVTNWRGSTSDVNLMFVTNFNASVPAAATDDPMWRYD